MSEKAWPVKYSKLLYNMGRDFWDMQYTPTFFLYTYKFSKKDTERARSKRKFRN